ncbi:MAG: YbaB/EbfC family nucleoid-associated protein [Bacteroidetes bacterium]|nr:YbaB/EbfC family nucleoid-associated protein [Bacteroidota bacterium]
MGFFDQMKQLQELKQKMEETKKKLDETLVYGENDWVKVSATGNRRIKDIEILKTDDKLVLEGKIQSAVNEALDKAEAVMQKEMMSNMPQIPGLG